MGIGVGGKFAKLICSIKLPALIFSFALAVSIVVGSKIVYSGSIYDSLSANYMKNFFLVDIVWLILFTLILVVPVSLVPLGLRKISQIQWKTCAPKSIGEKVRLFLSVLFLISLAWLPILLTYAPGSVHTDGLASVKQSLGLASHWSNQHPVLYTLFVKQFISIGVKLGSINLGVFLYTCTQYLIMASAFSYLVLWLANKNTPRVLLLLIVLYYAVVPVFPSYAIAMLKDPLFAVFILLYSLFLFDIVASDGGSIRRGKGIAYFVILSLLIIFFRNNGILVVIGVGSALAILYRNSIKPFYVAFVLLIVLTFVIQGPVYDRLGIYKRPAESLGIPIQQMAYVIATDGSLSAEDEAFLYKLFPEEKWTLSYTPLLVDSIKWDHEDFDTDYLAANEKTFFKVWLDMLIRNPEAYFKAYCLETFGYWKIGVENSYGYLFFSTNSNEYGIHTVDLFENLTGTSLAPFVQKLMGSDGTNGYVSAGLIVWITFLSAAAVFLIKKGRYVIPLLPCILSWLSLMAAAPVAFGFRYLFMIAATLPFIVLVPLLVFLQQRKDRDV